MCKVNMFEVNTDAKALVNILNYNEHTGILTWRYRQEMNKTWNTRYSGMPALNYKQKNGYLVGNINGSRVYAHRIAWAIKHGEWPKEEIDHINRIRSDNRIENLRQANRSENTTNKTKREGTYSNFKGVTWHKRDGYWMAQIMKNRKRIYLGRFSSEEEAYNAYVYASKILHGEFSSV